MLQAIPVLHLFSSQKEVFYTYIDEEKPGGTKEIKEGKEYFSVFYHAISISEVEKTYLPFFINAPASPVLEYVTPPPNVC